MSSDDEEEKEETASQALCKLARWIVRDGIDSDHLDGYMRRLLSNRLVELHAACRVQAAVISHCFAGLAAKEIAARFRESARGLERAGTSGIRLTQLDHGPRQLQTRAINRSELRAAETRPAGNESSKEHSSCLPEFVAAIVFAAVGIGFAMNWPEGSLCHSSDEPFDWSLRVISAGVYLLLGLISAFEGILRARRGNHCRDK